MTLFSGSAAWTTDQHATLPNRLGLSFGSSKEVKGCTEQRKTVLSPCQMEKMLRLHSCVGMVRGVTCWTARRRSLVTLHRVLLQPHRARAIALQCSANGWPVSVRLATPYQDSEFQTHNVTGTGANLSRVRLSGFTSRIWLLQTRQFRCTGPLTLVQQRRLDLALLCICSSHTSPFSKVTRAAEG